MECQEARKRFFPCLDHELSPQEEKALYAHVHMCPVCGAEFDSAKNIHHILQKTVLPVVPPPDLTERIMAQIPVIYGEKDDAASCRTEIPGLMERFKQYLAGLGERWKNALGGWQLRTAAVTVAILAIILFNNMSDIPGFQKPENLTPDIDIASVDPGINKEHYPNPSKTADPGPVEDTGSEDARENSEENSPVEEGPKVQEGEVPSKDNDQPDTVDPSVDTHVLPQLSAHEEGEGTIEVVSLIENDQQNVFHPVLIQGGKYLRYLVSHNGDSEEWELELREGAEPQKAQSDFVFTDGGDVAPSGKIPEWLSSTDPVKDAKTKVIAWSPDKKRVAINLRSSNSDSTGLWIAQADGSALWQAVQTGGGNELAWSPDGMKIAFTDKSGNLSVFYLIENLLFPVTGSGDNFTKLGHLVWTPDSKELIFDGQKNADSPLGIYRVVLP